MIVINLGLGRLSLELIISKEMDCFPKSISHDLKYCWQNVSYFIHSFSKPL